MDVVLEYYRSLFYLTLPYTLEDEVALHNGFLWDDHLKKWYTPHYKVASRLRDYCNDHALKILNKKAPSFSPWSGKLLYNPLRTPFKYQKESASQILTRASIGLDSYLADDPGLGKSFTLSMVLSSLPGFSLLFVPPFLKLNWEEELLRGLHSKRKIQIIDTKKNIDYDSEILICPDSLIINPDVRQELKRRSFKWLAYDEAHRLKNDEAKKTIFTFGNEKEMLRNRSLINIADHVVLMSGTPMPNRTIELYPPIAALAPEIIGFRNKYSFGHRFCLPVKQGGRTVYTGSANLDELSKITKSGFFIRHRKEDVLKELPPKKERIIFLSEDAGPKLKEFEKSALNGSTSLKEIIKRHDRDPKGEIAKLRKQIGLAKVKSATELILADLEEKGRPIIIFGWHNEVLQKMKENFRKYRPFYIDGRTPMNERYAQVKKYQSDKTLVFIGNMKAMGVGLTLTKAKAVYHLEPSWDPGTNDQASDRAHRIGQTDQVEVFYLLMRKTIDEYVVRGSLLKQDNIKKLF